MSRVYTVSLAAHRQQAASQDTLYVVGPGHVAIVRDITLLRGALGQGQHLCAIYRDGPEGLVAIEYVTLDEAHPYAHWQGRQVLDEGDQLIGVTTSESVTIAITGYLLSAP